MQKKIFLSVFFIAIFLKTKLEKNYTFLSVWIYLFFQTNHDQKYTIRKLLSIIQPYKQKTFKINSIIIESSSLFFKVNRVKYTNYGMLSVI